MSCRNVQACKAVVEGTWLSQRHASILAGTARSQTDANMVLGMLGRDSHRAAYLAFFKFYFKTESF